MVQQMCTKSKFEGDPYIDSVVGRAVLTIAYTRGTRVGGLLPPNNKQGASSGARADYEVKRKEGEKAIPYLAT